MTKINKGGRPRKTLTEEQLAQVEGLAACLSQDMIADYFGMARNTFAAIVKRQPKVFERYKRGKAKAVGTIAQGLIKQAREGNIAAAIFYLKTQARWKEVQELEHSGPNGGPLTNKITVEFVDADSVAK